MSALRLIWLMGSRGLLFAALGFIAFMLATSLALPSFDTTAHHYCFQSGMFHSFGICVRLGPPLSHDLFMFAVCSGTLAIGVVLGAHRGFKQWRTRALAGW